LRAFRDHDGEFRVDADPEVYLRALEIVIHPADWRDVVTALPKDTSFAVGGLPGSFTFMGVEVQGA
jgi:hypothetical protein